MNFLNIIKLKSHSNGDERDGSALRALVIIPEVPGLISNFQQPHDNSQLSETSVPGDPIPSSSLHGHQAHVTHVKLN